MLPTSSVSSPDARRGLFSVDAWSPEFGTSLVGGDLEETRVDVDCGVEVPVDGWEPVTPPPASLDRVAFVDGVRRTDARVWFADGDTSVAAACASLAAGAVVCPFGGGRAEIVGVAVDRGVYAAMGSTARAISTPLGDYRLVVCADGRPETLHNTITAAMTDLERRVPVPDVGLVVYDGPLRGRSNPRGVGYIKTQHVLYLPEQLHGVLAALDAGQRTPMFRIGAGTPQPRLSWYLRLPGPRAHPLAGVVRCELPPQIRGDAAARRAGVVSAILPQFASSPHRDPRAPQNLTPIGGLEQHLRHQLGDQHLLLRALLSAAFAEENTAP